MAFLSLFVLVSVVHAQDPDALVREAQLVLDNNWMGHSTKPSPNLYPHQWSWDSCFISIGYSHYNQSRAMEELRTLFKAQWKNGMVPHIVFNPEYWNSTNYFPGPDWWQSYNVPDAPQGINTSGICNPPVHSSAILRIYENTQNNESFNFLKEMYPKLGSWHTYLWSDRDPERTGLIYTRHPWESGMDNSPVWDPVLNRMQLRPDQIPAYNRTDCKYVNCTDRPSQFDYDRYVYLLVLYRNNSYNDSAIQKLSPFLVVDTLFNAVWSQANMDLAQIATIIGEFEDAKRWQSLANATKAAMNEHLWNAQEKTYQDYDLVSKSFITDNVIAGNFMPIYAQIPSNEQLDSMLFKWLNTDHFCFANSSSCYVLPTLDMMSANFTDHNYWRGPIWINMNWMLYNGLRRYNGTFVPMREEYLDSLWNSTMELVSRNGMYEYFSPVDGQAHGTGNFSWTSSLIIDLIMSQNSTAHVTQKSP